MFIDQFIAFASENDAEIIKALDHPFEFSPGGQLHGDMAAISPDPVEKLVLYIDLVLDHRSLPSSWLRVVVSP